MKRLILIFLIIFLSAFVYAADFTPQGNINGRSIYDIYNFKNIYNFSNISGNRVSASNVYTNVLYFNTTSGTPSNLSNGICYFTDGGDNVLNCVYDSTNGVIQQVGEELYAPQTVKNVDSTQINNCDPVRFFSAQGQHQTIKRATSASYRSAQATIGLATQDIAINGFGRVTVFGAVNDCNTAAWADGSQLFLNRTGGLTTSLPPKNETIVFIGTVGYSHSQHGRIDVNVIVVPSITDLTFVNASNANNSVLVYNNVTGIWSSQVLNLSSGNYVSKTGDTMSGNLFFSNNSNSYITKLFNTGVSNGLFITGETGNAVVDAAGNDGGSINIYAASGQPVQVSGGATNNYAGGDGGALSLYAGNGGNSDDSLGGIGGAVNIRAGDAGGSATPTSTVSGGNVYIYAGNSNSIDGPVNGGDIYISGGEGAQGGDYGTLYFQANGGASTFGGTVTASSYSGSGEFLYNVPYSALVGVPSLSNYTQKQNSETITGNWIFNPTSNITFSSGTVQFYSPVFFRNNVTLVNQVITASQNNSGYIIKSLAGTTIGRWADDNGTANFYSNGRINGSGIDVDTNATIGKVYIGGLMSRIGTLTDDNFSIYRNNTEIISLQINRVKINSSVDITSKLNKNYTYPTFGTQTASDRGAIHIVPNGTNKDISAITFDGNTAGSVLGYPAAGIYVDSSSNFGSKMYFGTTDAFSQVKGRMIIDSNGRVGINTTTPAAVLDVTGGSLVTGYSAVTGRLNLGRSTDIAGLFPDGIPQLNIDTRDLAKYAGIDLRGSGSGYVHAAVILSTNSSATGDKGRGLGTYYDQLAVNATWYSGLPYRTTGLQSDAFVINRRAGAGVTTDGADVIDADVTNLFYIDSFGTGFGTTAPKGTVDIYGNLTIELKNASVDSQPLILLGNASIWLDAPNVGFAAAGVNAPVLTAWNNTVAEEYCFAGTTRNEYMVGSIEFPHNMKENSIISPHIHTGKSTNNNGNYTFNLAGYIKNVTGSYSQTFNANVTITSTSVGGQWDKVLTDFPDINTTGFGIGSIFNYRIIRLQDNPADNYADCVGLEQFSFHYEADTLGSVSKYNKWS